MTIPCYSEPEPNAKGDFSAHLSRRLRASFRKGRLRHPSYVRCSPTISNTFSETTGPTAAKFYLQSPGRSETKTCLNGLGHMTNMATMPTYGKNLKKSSSLEPMNRRPWNWSVASSIWVLPKLFKWWPWIVLDPFYTEIKFGYSGFCVGESANHFFFETVAAYVSNVTEVFNYMKLNEYEYQRSRLF